MFVLRLTAPALIASLAAGCAHQQPSAPASGQPASAPTSAPATRSKGFTKIPGAKAKADEPKRDDTVEACRALITAYAVTRDQVDSDAFGALFADDAEFVFGKNHVKGPAAIVALMQERAKGTTTRHLMTTAHIKSIDADHAEGVSYFVVFSEPPMKKGGQPIPSEGPRAIIEYHDKFVRKAGVWKFARREVKLVYALR